MVARLAMSRKRAFCPYCGCVIKPDVGACHNHRDLIEKDPQTARVTVTGTGGRGIVTDLERDPGEALPVLPPRAPQSG